MESSGTAHQCRLLSAPIESIDSDVHSRGLLVRHRGLLVRHSIRAQALENQFKHSDSEYSDSGTDHDDGEDDPSNSDCESSTSGPNNEEPQSLCNGLIKLDEGDRLHEIIKRGFISGLGSLGMQTSVDSILRNSCSSFTGQARLQSFRIFARAVEKKCGGSANLRYAWYGGSKDEIGKIISHGFSQCPNAKNKGLFGCGVHLYPENLCIDSVKSSTVDEEGLRHVLLCRVILGKTELIHPGSEHCHPSSDEFDSGVDNLVAPKKYIVWSTHMNTHILPEYIISFRAPFCSGGRPRITVPRRKPTSPWMPFSALIPVLSKFLPPHTNRLISQCRNDYIERKVSRHELIRQLREMAGDELLSAVVKSFRDKQLKASTDFSTTNCSSTTHSRSGRKLGTQAD